MLERCLLLSSVWGCVDVFMEKEMAWYFQYSCLENPMDRGAWWATGHGVTRVEHNLATKAPPPDVFREG